MNIRRSLISSSVIEQLLFCGFNIGEGSSSLIKRYGVCFMRFTWICGIGDNVDLTYKGDFFRSGLYGVEGILLVSLCGIFSISLVLQERSLFCFEKLHPGVFGSKEGLGVLIGKQMLDWDFIVFTMRIGEFIVEAIGDEAFWVDMGLWLVLGFICLDIFTVTFNFLSDDIFIEMFKNPDRNI